MKSKSSASVFSLLVAALQVCFFLLSVQPTYGLGGFPVKKLSRKTQRSLAGNLGGGVDYSSALLIVVSQKKGEGDFSKVQDAINAVPVDNKNLIFIRVLPGIYREKVTIPVEKPYIILSGRNASNTVITWNENAGATGGTYFCATMTVLASDFVARFITIQNSYGPGDQAVAIRISADRSAFYSCRFLGFQDTVLDDSGRHYFKNCFIEGAADFICGDGQSIYEKCHLHTVPLLNGAITAQRRLSPGEQSGFVFIHSKITGAGLMFLGRAWGPYSRVIFAYTYMDNIIFPQGWDDWNDAGRQKTVTYAQYKCSGPGSNSAGRVPWSFELSDRDAAPFLSNSFVNGEQWIRKMPTRLRRATNLTPKNG
ncbi:hypothetical protein SUGI_0798720 [Cryptomeria japonica]|nr:hypothetical protein SUGI_0798720 [Cryptomeria japonica]